MEKCARQCQLIQQIINLNKAINGVKSTENSEFINPNENIKLNRQVTQKMLDKLVDNNTDEDSEDLRASFNDQVKQFIEKIKKRAIEKLKENLIEDTRNEIQARTIGGNGSGAEPEAKGQKGPGGLDAQEVFDSLPEILQDAF